MATRIDTLKTYEMIAAAGVEDKAARAISNAIADSNTNMRADLATTGDLEKLGLRLEKVIAEGQRDTNKNIAEVQDKLQNRLWATIVIIVTLTGAINAAVSHWMIPAAVATVAAAPPAAAPQ